MSTAPSDLILTKDTKTGQTTFIQARCVCGFVGTIYPVQAADAAVGQANYHDIREHGDLSSIRKPYAPRGAE